MSKLTEELDKKFFPQKKIIKEPSQSSSLLVQDPVDGTIFSSVGGIGINTVGYNTQIAYIAQHKNVLIQLWRDVSRLPEVDEAIDEISNETLTFDETENLPLELDLEDLEVSKNLKKTIQEKFEKILHLLQFQELGDEIFKKWYIDGSLIVESIFDNKKLKDGIQLIKFISPMGFFKITDKTTGDFKYFSVPDETLRNRTNVLSPEDLYSDKTITYEREQITYVTSGILSQDSLYYLSPLHKAVKSTNHLELVEESIIISRLTKAGDKRAFKVDTGRLPPKKADAFVKKLMKQHKKSLSYDATSGRLIGRKKTVPLVEDYWLPVNSDGKGTDVTTIPGTQQDFDQINDLEYFLKKTYKALGIPLSRRQEDTKDFRITSKSNLETEYDEIKFFKKILKLRKKFKVLFIDLLEKELISTKIFNYNDWLKIKPQIKIIFRNINDFARNKKLTNFEDTFDLIGNVSDLVEQGFISKGFIRREILNFTDEEIESLKKEREKEKKEEPEDETPDF